MAEIILKDDQANEKIIVVEPDTEIVVRDEFVPCSGCPDIVLSSCIDKDGYCPNCWEGKMDDLNTKEEMAKWLTERGWSYEHPGYWRYDMSNGITVMVGDYIGLYIPDDDGQIDRAFMVISYQEYTDDKVLDMRAENLLPLGVADAILVAIKYDRTEDKVWDMACGELAYPDGIMVYNVKEPHRNIKIPGELLTNRPVEEWDADDHAYLASLAEVIKRWLDNNLS